MNEKQKHIDETVKEWSIVKVPCTDGVTRIGIDYDGEWPQSLVIEANVTYNDTTYKCLEYAEQLQMPVFDGGDGDYDTDWKKVEY